MGWDREMRMDGMGLRDENRWDRIARYEWIGRDHEMQMGGMRSRDGNGWDRGM